MQRKRAFKPLLEFIDKYIMEDLSDELLPHIKYLLKNYVQFFTSDEEYEPSMQEKLAEALSHHEKETYSK